MNSLAHPQLHFTPEVLDPSGPRELVILGSTGSIGTQAIDVVLRNPDRFKVVALSAAGGRVELLAEQALQLGVHTVAVADPAAVPALREALAAKAAGRALPEIIAGPDAATELAKAECHSVLNGITGSIGLRPTLAALEAGRVLVLANKESLIVGGPLVKAVAKPGQIVPVDSEHAALFQALAGGTRAEVRKLVVTASGGPSARSATAPVSSWPASPRRTHSPTPPGRWARS
jgi:1-deoxy-D-xylulose-5-phosphate reductoisomerase